MNYFHIKTRGNFIKYGFFKNLREISVEMTDKFDSTFPKVGVLVKLLSIKIKAVHNDLKI